MVQSIKMSDEELRKIYGKYKKKELIEVIIALSKVVEFVKPEPYFVEDIFTTTGVDKMIMKIT